MIIVNDDGARLNADLALHELGIILKSRSGTERNRDYRAALELLLSRLDRAQIQYDIFLDSRPVRQRGHAANRLNFNHESPIAERFNELVGAMNAEGASKGALRQLLIVAPELTATELLTSIGIIEGPPEIRRLPAVDLRKVTPFHIHRAVAILLAGGDAPNFAESREYDALTDDGTPLAPKKVFGLALQEALGIDAFPGHFTAGWRGICFELLEEAGLWIVPKQGAVARPKATSEQVEAEILELKPTEEERSWLEGNPKIGPHLRRERSPGLAKQKKREFIEKHGRLFCERCLLDPVEYYGDEAGAACIEVHHNRVHVADMLPGHRSVTEDLQCVCASCHRVLHRKLALGLADPL